MRKRAVDKLAGVAQPAMAKAMPLVPVRKAEMNELQIPKQDFIDLLLGFVAERYKPVPDGSVRHIDVGFSPDGETVRLMVTDEEKQATDEPA